MLLLIGTFNKRKTYVFHIYEGFKEVLGLCALNADFKSFGQLGNNPCTVDLKNVKQDTNCNELHKDYFFTCIFRIFEIPDLFLDQCRSIVYSFGRSCAGEYNFTFF